MKKYLCIGGDVDGKHFTARQVAQMFRVSPDDCEFTEAWDQPIDLGMSALLELRPQANGVHSLAVVLGEREQFREAAKKQAPRMSLLQLWHDLNGQLGWVSGFIEANCHGDGQLRAECRKVLTDVRASMQTLFEMANKEQS